MSSMIRENKYFVLKKCVFLSFKVEKNKNTVVILKKRFSLFHHPLKGKVSSKLLNIRKASVLNYVQVGRGNQDHRGLKFIRRSKTPTKDLGQGYKIVSVQIPKV